MRRARRAIGTWRWFGVAAFALVMVVGGIIGLLAFARPSVSEAENRTLTVFPAFTIEGFLDGSYFTDISLWYADTYPLREPMVEADHAMDSLFGVSVDRGLVGGNVQADEIPVEEPDSTELADSALDQPTVPVEAPDEHVIAAAVQDSIMNGLYIENGAAYSIYYFDQQGASTYIEAANTAAEKLDGTAKVYSLLVPASASVLPQDVYESVGGSDQRQTFDYVRTRLDRRVAHVDLLDTMRNHSSEYVFFRTDHHWTMRGAYHSYVEFCRAKGIEPRSLDSFAYRDDGIFTGTYYDSIAELMTPDSDDFEAFSPQGARDITCWGAEGDEWVEPIVEDTGDWETSRKYDGLSGCDPASSLIHNESIGDGSACLVVKDSYGCAFEPFLVDNYEYVYAIDPRYYLAGTVSDFVKEHDIQDVVFVYGMKVGLDQRYASLLLASI